MPLGFPGGMDAGNVQVYLGTVPAADLLPCLCSFVVTIE